MWVALWKMLGHICVLGGVVVTVVGVDESVVELEECVGSIVGNAWPCLCCCCDSVWC